MDKYIKYKKKYLDLKNNLHKIDNKKKKSIDDKYRSLIKLNILINKDKSKYLKYKYKYLNLLYSKEDNIDNVISGGSNDDKIDLDFSTADQSEFDSTAESYINNIRDSVDYHMKEKELKSSFINAKYLHLFEFILKRLIPVNVYERLNNYLLKNMNGIKWIEKKSFNKQIEIEIIDLDQITQTNLINSTNQTNQINQKYISIDEQRFYNIKKVNDLYKKNLKEYFDKNRCLQVNNIKIVKFNSISFIYQISHILNKKIWNTFYQNFENIAIKHNGIHYFNIDNSDNNIFPSYIDDNIYFSNIWTIANDIKLSNDNLNTLKSLLFNTPISLKNLNNNEEKIFIKLDFNEYLKDVSFIEKIGENEFIILNKNFIPNDLFKLLAKLNKKKLVSNIYIYYKNKFYRKTNYINLFSEEVKQLFIINKVLIKNYFVEKSNEKKKIVLNEIFESYNNKNSNNSYKNNFNDFELFNNNLLFDKSYFSNIPESKSMDFIDVFKEKLINKRLYFQATNKEKHYSIRLFPKKNNDNIDFSIWIRDNNIKKISDFIPNEPVFLGIGDITWLILYPLWLEIIFWLGFPITYSIYNIYKKLNYMYIKSINEYAKSKILLRKQIFINFNSFRFSFMKLINLKNLILDKNIDEKIEIIKNNYEKNISEIKILLK